MVAREICRRPGLDIIYTDEDKIGPQGRRYDPHLKSDWNPDLFMSQNMISHLGVYRAALVRDVGGFVQSTTEARITILRCVSSRAQIRPVSSTYPTCSITGEPPPTLPLA